MSQLKTTYKSTKGYKDKEVLARILARGKIVRKYRKLTYIKNFAPKRLKKHRNAMNLLLQQGKQASKLTQMKRDVVDFLEKDCNSRMSARKGQTVAKHKEKRQKRFLLKSLQELHEDFKKTVDYQVLQFTSLLGALPKM